MVCCCSDAFDPIPDEVVEQPPTKVGNANKAAAGGVVEMAPIQALETKTAEVESESESEEEYDEEKSVEDLEEILVSGEFALGKPSSSKLQASLTSSHHAFISYFQ
jgi:hypothetical protein